LQTYGSDLLTYNLGSALDSGSSERRECYFDTFARGGFFSETTYGLGFATKTRTDGKVLSVSVPSREQLAKQTRRFGGGGTETFEVEGGAAALRAEGLSVPEIARTLGVTEKEVKAELAA
jgi:hypothetical protein